MAGISKWAMTCLVILRLVTAQAWGDQIIRGSDGLEASIPTTPNCGTTKVIVSAPDASAYEGDRITLQRLLGGARAAISLDCPTLKGLDVTGLAAGKPMFQAKLTAGGGWKLPADTGLKAAGVAPPSPVTSWTNGTAPVRIGRPPDRLASDAGSTTDACAGYGRPGEQSSQELSGAFEKLKSRVAKQWKSSIDDEDVVLALYHQAGDDGARAVLLMEYASYKLRKGRDKDRALSSLQKAASLSPQVNLGVGYILIAFHEYDLAIRIHQDGLIKFKDDPATAAVLRMQINDLTQCQHAGSPSLAQTTGPTSAPNDRNLSQTQPGPEAGVPALTKRNSQTDAQSAKILRSSVAAAFGRKLNDSQITTLVRGRDLLMEALPDMTDGFVLESVFEEDGRLLKRVDDAVTESGKWFVESDKLCIAEPDNAEAKCRDVYRDDHEHLTLIAPPSPPQTVLSVTLPPPDRAQRPNDWTFPEIKSFAARQLSLFVWSMKKSLPEPVSTKLEATARKECASNPSFSCLVSAACILNSHTPDADAVLFLQRGYESGGRFRWRAALNAAYLMIASQGAEPDLAEAKRWLKIAEESGDSDIKNAAQVFMIHLSTI